MSLRRVDYAVCIPTLALSRSGSKGIISGSPKEPPHIDIIIQLYGDIVKTRNKRLLGYPPLRGMNLQM
jgi:hypothetical protein